MPAPVWPTPRPAGAGQPENHAVSMGNYAQHHQFGRFSDEYLRSYWARERELVRRRRERMGNARRLGTHTREEWAEMLEACGRRCAKCGRRDVTKDHIIPISMGGSDSIRNLQPLCNKCNCGKRKDTTDHRIGKPWMQEKWLPILQEE